MQVGKILQNPYLQAATKGEFQFLCCRVECESFLFLTVRYRTDERESGLLTFPLLKRRTVWMPSKTSHLLSGN